MTTPDQGRRILDHGYVKLVETWGSDERIIEAARMSTQKGFNGWGGEVCAKCHEVVRISQDNDGTTFKHCVNLKCDVDRCHDPLPSVVGDEKLLKFLYDNNHATPFEMAGMIIEVQAPIIVFREWHRHRTQSYNEASARYEPLPEIDYVPSLERVMINAGGSNRQAGTIAGAESLNEAAAQEWLHHLSLLQRELEKHYQKGLAIGVPKELARLSMTVGRYSRMRASANLRNWLGFLTLRMDSKAQWEIRQFANAVGDLISLSFPRTYELFSNKMFDRSLQERMSK
jgi:thymidylate synthase (FAD)